MMEGEEIINPGGTPTADAVYSYSGLGGGGGGGSCTTLEAPDDGVVLLALGPGPASASTDGPATTYPDLTTYPTTPRSNVPYTDWTTTAHGGAHLHSQSVVGVGAYAYPDPDLVMAAMEHSGSASAAPATRNIMPSSSTGPVTIGESYYTDMLMEHLSSDDMYPAAWNDNVAYPGGSVTHSAAINGLATAYPGGLKLNPNAAVVTAGGPDTNAAAVGYTIDVYGQGMADLGSERLHPTGTPAAAAAATEPGGAGGYYYYNSGMALRQDAAVSQDDQVAGAVAEPVRGGLGGLGLAAISVAVAGLNAGGMDTPVAAFALFGVLIAGVILVTVRVFSA